MSETRGRAALETVRSHALLVSALVALFAFRSPVRAQEPMIEAFAAVATGEDLANLTGVRGRVVLGRIVFSAWSASGTSRRMAQPCAGLIFEEEIGDCRRQPVVQDATAKGISIGLVASRERFGLRFLMMPHVGLTELRHEQIGMMSGRELRGSAGGLQAGYTIVGQRHLFGGFAVGAAIDAALILPYTPECADCYVAFRDGIATAGLSLLASWRFR